jgi:hypothetical protein
MKTPPAPPMKTTYTMWSLFRNCRRACELRYVKELVPIEREGSLAFGSLIHECLELWHSRRSLEMVLIHIDQACKGRVSDERVKNTGTWRGR